MKNRVLLCSVTAAAIGWGCCFQALMLSAQEKDQTPREFQGDRPQRPKGPQGPEAPKAPRAPQTPRPDRPQGPPDANRPAEGGGSGGYQGRPNASSMMMRMSGRIMIIAPGAEAQVHQEVEEDMTTMLHLLERAIEKDLGSSGDDVNNYRNIPAVLSSESRATYLDDYGILFTLRTPQVLNGPANSERPHAKPGPRGNQWERARQELFGGEGARDYRPNPMQYDAAKVSALKESLFGLLRDATNLRHLKADQNVAIILAGSPSLGQRPSNPQPEEGNREGSPLERFRTQLSRATALVLRAKKSDIDAFAQGKLTAEQFKAKVSVVNN